MVTRLLQFSVAFMLISFSLTALAQKENAKKPSLLVAPFSKREATAKQSAWAKHLGKKVIETNSIGMKLALIPAGEFQMGSPQSEKDRDDNEHQHPVRLTKPFYLCTTEVTQKQWKSIMGTTPWLEKGKAKFGVTENANHPATYVSWNAAQEFITKLNKKEGVTYRLPSEAEWEYACRGGTTSPFHFGGTSNGSKSNINGNTPYGTTRKGKYLRRTSSVGSYESNNFGLYDMHGNVWEWCNDRYDKDYYNQFGSNVSVDPPGPNPPGPNPPGPKGVPTNRRVLRGGSWFNSARYSRSANRSWSSPADQYDFIGFRLSRTP